MVVSLMSAYTLAQRHLTEMPPQTTTGVKTSKTSLMQGGISSATTAFWSLQTQISYEAALSSLCTS